MGNRAVCRSSDGPSPCRHGIASGPHLVTQPVDAPERDGYAMALHLSGLMREERTWRNPIVTHGHPTRVTMRDGIARACNRCHPSAKPERDSYIMTPVTTGAMPDSRSWCNPIVTRGHFPVLTTWNGNAAAPRPHSCNAHWARQRLWSGSRWLSHKAAPSPRHRGIVTP